MQQVAAFYQYRPEAMSSPKAKVGRSNRSGTPINQRLSRSADTVRDSPVSCQMSERPRFVATCRRRAPRSADRPACSQQSAGLRNPADCSGAVPASPRGPWRLPNDVARRSLQAPTPANPTTGNRDIRRYPSSRWRMLGNKCERRGATRGSSGALWRLPLPKQGAERFGFDKAGQRSDLAKRDTRRDCGACG